jgi:hypothetical protein
LLAQGPAARITAEISSSAGHDPQLASSNGENRQ